MVYVYKVRRGFKRPSHWLLPHRRQDSCRTVYQAEYRSWSVAAEGYSWAWCWSVVGQRLPRAERRARRPATPRPDPPGLSLPPPWSVPAAAAESPSGSRPLKHLCDCRINTVKLCRVKIIKWFNLRVKVVVFVPQWVNWGCSHYKTKLCQTKAEENNEFRGMERVKGQLKSYPQIIMTEYHSHQFLCLVVFPR